MTHMTSPGLPESLRRRVQSFASRPSLVALVVPLLLTQCGGDAVDKPTSPGSGDGVPSGATTTDGGGADSASRVDAARPGDARDASPDAITVPQPSTKGVRAFYTDITSGPSTGGQGGKGAFVSVYGRGFGASQGSSTVTIGGGAADNYPLWTDSKIVAQLGAGAHTGAVVVNVSGKGASNGLPFTVRSGNIYFVATTGADANDGTFAQPWQSLLAAKTRLMPGDILYVMDGVTQTTADYASAALCLANGYGCNTRAGTQVMPIAMVVYPGARATVGCGDASCPGIGIRLMLEYWTVAGFDAVANTGGFSAAFDVSPLDGVGATVAVRGQRIIGNRMTGGYYGMSMSAVSEINVLGNEVFAVPHSAIYHGGYGPSENSEVAWNWIHDIGADGFGVKYYGHAARDSASGISIHDNLIYNTKRAPILVGGSDGHAPWIHDTRIYNNVIFGFGPGPEGAIRIGNAGVDETLADVVISHNTLVDNNNSIEIDACRSATIVNNVFAQSSGAFVAGHLGSGAITFDHNLWFGGTGAPSDAHAVTGDPMFVNGTGHDYRLRAGSPALDIGINAMVWLDFDGNPRPTGGGPDLGAFELVP